MAVMLAEKAVEQILTKTPSTPTLACQKGCSYCCHLKVEAFPFEVYGIAAYVWSTWTPDEVLALYRRLEETAKKSTGLSPEAYLAQKIPCALLSEDGTCRAYSVRPIACVAYHSLSKEECIAAHDNPSEPWVTQVAELIIGVHGVSLGVLNVVDPKLMARPRTESQKDLHALLLPVLRDRIQSRWGKSALLAQECEGA